MHLPRTRPAYVHAGANLIDLPRWTERYVSRLTDGRIKPDARHTHLRRLATAILAGDDPWAASEFALLLAVLPDAEDRAAYPLWAPGLPSVADAAAFRAQVEELAWKWRTAALIGTPVPKQASGARRYIAEVIADELVFFADEDVARWLRHAAHDLIRIEYVLLRSH